ncbi:adhesion G-protein coupled receptor D1-like [Dendronephthya gigantea]|uniref:adhesion G-protein coupled receptor D1-like n=1 Tax=Dendronephthya gigantea TaxID=151771 RepID=UPI00106C8D66|nr:adhesion G-protein coupled receptor D1-like [Dendronephthya gigantea]
MDILRFSVAILLLGFVQGRVRHEYLGCFKDTSTRAMPVALPRDRSDLLKSCKQEAAFRGYTVFGIQNGVECWSGPDAASTYKKYGVSDKCRNGLGGPWANDVYRVHTDNAQLAGILSDIISDANSIDDVDLNIFVSQSSKLLNLSSSEWKKDPKVADTFLSATEGLLDLGMNSSKDKSAISEVMVFSVSQEDTKDKESLVFPDYEDAAFSKQSSTDSFTVPTTKDTDKTNIGGYVYSNLHEKLTTSLNKSDEMYRSDLHQEIVSKVLSCQVNPQIRFGVNTNRTVQITLQHHKEMSSEATPICAFWKHGENNESGLWSTEGCNVMSSNKTHTQCNCTHLTNFAILMQYRKVEVDNRHRRALTILTNIGCSLSLIAIFVTVSIYIFFGLYRSTNFHIHLNLCFAIAMAQIFLLFSVKGRNNKGLCLAVSICLHYFCLCVFTWMLVEGIQIYKKVVSIFSSSMNLISCHAIGWGLPILIVLITYFSRKDHYTDEDTCWLSPDYRIRWAFIAPVLLIIMINIIVTVITLRKRLHLRTVTTKEMSYKVRTSLRALFVLLPIFGLTWLFGIFGFSSDAVAAMYLFVILNSSQGLLIFIFHCALNQEVRKIIFQNRQIHIRGGTLSTGSNKPPLQKIPSKNSEYSNKDTSRHSSARSVKENGETCDDVQLTENTLATTPQTQNHLVP